MTTTKPTPTAREKARLRCPECDRPCAAPQGLAAHRRKAHGVAGAGSRRPETNGARRPTPAPAPRTASAPDTSGGGQRHVLTLEGGGTLVIEITGASIFTLTDRDRDLVGAVADLIRNHES